MEISSSLRAPQAAKAEEKRSADAIVAGSANPGKKGKDSARSRSRSRKEKRDKRHHRDHSKDKHKHHHHEHRGRRSDSENSSSESYDSDRRRAHGSRHRNDNDSCDLRSSQRRRDDSVDKDKNKPAPPDFAQPYAYRSKEEKKRKESSENDAECVKKVESQLKELEEQNKSATKHAFVEEVPEKDQKAGIEIFLPNTSIILPEVPALPPVPEVPPPEKKVDLTWKDTRGGVEGESMDMDIDDIAAKIASKPRRKAQPLGKIPSLTPLQIELKLSPLPPKPEPEAATKVKENPLPPPAAIIPLPVSASVPAPVPAVAAEAATIPEGKPETLEMAAAPEQKEPIAKDGSEGEDEKEEAKFARINTQEEIVRRQQYFKMLELEREKCAGTKPSAPVPVTEPKKEEAKSPKEGDEEKSNRPHHATPL